MSFVHLNLHTEYSLVDSTVRIKPLINRVVELGMPAVAVTDQCNLFALVKFFKAAEAAGIKPLAGSDLWVANPESPDQPDRLTVLCQNRRGYGSLCRLISRAYLERSGRFAVVQKDWLEQENDGLIALAGATHGEFGRLLLDGKPKRAAETLGYWAGLFDDRFYVDLTRTGREGERRYEDGALDAAHRCGLPVVATNDVRFVHQSDYAAHEARVCIHEGRMLNDPSRPRNYTAEQYLRSPQEMAQVFDDIPETLTNALELAKRCNLSLDLGTYYLPDFPVPENHTIESHLRSEAQRGLEERLAVHPVAEGFSLDDYNDRLEHELGVICQMGFPGYFLIVADFIRWAKEQLIPVGPGRGSGAGSLVAYCLGITDLDPLEHELLFERFLNPERVSMPDFDVDFCMDRRDEVIDYVAQTYGRGHVSQIITYGSMAARAVVRDTGRVLGMPYGQVDGVAKLIPMTLGITLDAALAEEGELKERTETEDEVGELMGLAQSLEGLARNAGKHAGGVVIAPSALTEYCPLYCESGGESVVTQFDKDDVEAVGLVKFDFLGLRTLTIIDWAVEAINRGRQANQQEPLDINKLPMDDQRAFKLLQACDTTAVFQLESRGMKDLIRRLKPSSFDDIVALVALFRPGPLDSGMVDTYIDCKHGRAPVRYPHPDLEPILKETHGVILYQEQVMQIAQVLAGYTLGGADILRRAMGKKKPAEMAKQRTIFVDGAVGREIDAALAESIFDLMETFAGYGFNKSHSAAYALLSYQTAFLKAHYPAEFLAAVLSSDMDNTDKVVIFFDDARQRGLTIDPPNVNRSMYPFTATASDRILYGLGAIKGVGQSAIEGIIEERENGGPFADLMDFCTRVDLQKVNRRVIESLIKAGAMDDLGPNRGSLAHGLPEVLKAAEQHYRDQAAGQSDMFGAPTPVASPSQPATVADWDEEVRLSGERDTLGLYLSGHPIASLARDLTPIVSCTLGEAERHFGSKVGQRGSGYANRGTPGTLAGMVISVRRRGERSAFAVIEDPSGRMELAIYGNVLQDNSELLVRDQVVIAEGNLVPDDFSGGLQMRVNQLMSLDQALPRYVRAVAVRADAAFNIRQFREMIQRHQPGDTPVLLDYQSDGATARLKLDESCRVRPTRGLIKDLKQLPGVDAAQLVFA